MGRSPDRAAWTLLLVVVAAEVATALPWSGPGRAEGVVTDLDDHPVVGATVRLYPVGSPDIGPPSVQTDPDGRWMATGLAPGRWTIIIAAPGFSTSEGRITVQETARVLPVEVALRPLGEVTPSFAESPGTIFRWIEKGNDLLDQGRYEDARREYEKALVEVPPASQAEILRAVARTHFLQGNVDGTLDTLKLALVRAPDDQTTRQLFRAVLEETDRSEEAEGFLDALDRGGEDAVREWIDDLEVPEEREVAAVAVPLDPEVAELPIEEPQRDRRGRYRTSFSEPDPHGGLDTLLDRLGIDREEVASVDAKGGRYTLREESFHVYVPEAMPPQGFGIMVWISPGWFGGFTREEVRTTLEDHHLIWIGADHAGNRRPRWYRILLALDGVHNLRGLYRIDAERVYASGYSGGGRIASALAMLYPEVFRGGFSLFGCDYFRRVDMPDKPGAYWPPRYPPPSGEALRQIKTRNRFVLLTGELDFNRTQTKATYKRMLEEGFEHVMYLSIPEASHYDPVGREWLEQALLFLEGTG
jgi:tetratricopeptide (TPR) repeat protein